MIIIILWFSVGARTTGGIFRRHGEDGEDGRQDDEHDGDESDGRHLFDREEEILFIYREKKKI